MSSRVGSFRLQRKLASGPLGGAWLAHADDGAQALVKLAFQASPTDEFRLLAELDHPAVPRLAGCGVDGGTFWSATHWLDGTLLEEGLQAGADELEFAGAAVHALLYLAACGVIHGDVHPGNIMAARSGYAARLLDFGLATDREAAPAGRRGFIAPEVNAGGFRTAASDLYGLGASLRQRGAARSREVSRLAEGLVSPDPQVRISAAREFAAERGRPVCGPRRKCRDAEIAKVLALLQGGVQPATGLLFLGEPGMGKTDLLRRAAWEAAARGWIVEHEARGGVAELATRWERGLKPLLVAIDDIDGAGNAEAVSRAVQGLANVRATGVLVLATASADPPQWALDRRVLGPVGPDQVENIFRQVSGVDEISPEEVRRLAELTGGCPRYAVSVARAAVTTGAIEFRLGSWALRPQAPIPVPIDAADAARPLVGALDRRSQLMLAAISLASGSISRAALPVAAECSPDDLERLEEEGMVRTEGASVVPVDAAVGNAATERLSPAERACIHRRLAALIVETGAPPWVSAWHWVRAGEASPGIEASLAAAEELRELGDLHSARTLLAAARELAPEHHPDRIRIDAAAVVVDSHERAHEGIARRAEELAGLASDTKLKRQMAAVALCQWHRIRRWDELQAAARRMAPDVGDWVTQRAAFAEAIRKSASGDMGEDGGIGQDLDQCATVTEARFVAWRRAFRGDFRGSTRGALRAAKFAMRQRSWRDFGQAIEDAVAGLISSGHKSRARSVLAFGQAVANRVGRAVAMPSLLGAQATLASASGRVGRGLAAAHDYDRLVTILSLAPDMQERGRSLHALLLRFAGKAAEALKVLEDESRNGIQAYRAWEALPQCLALLDLGKCDQAGAHAGEAAELFRAAGDTSGAAFMRAVTALARRESGDKAGWIAEAQGLPETIPGDRHAEGMCSWIKMEAALKARDPIEAARWTAGILQLTHSHRLLGCEAAARAAVSCAAAGEKGIAEQLVGALSPLPDSPLIEVWAAVARAKLESQAVAAMKHLDGVRGFLPEAGVAARREWLAAASVSAREAGRPDEAASWERQHHLESQVKTSPGEGEHAVAPKSLASQVLDKVLDSAIAISGAERGCLVLVDSDRFEVRAARPEKCGLGAADAFSSTISDKVILSGAAFFSGDAMQDGRLQDSVSIPRLNVHSVVCMPFRLQGRILGSLYLDHRSKADAFDPGAIDALQTLSDLAAVAIENAQMFEESGRQKSALAERAQRLAHRLEEVELRGQGDADAGLKYRYPAIVGRGTAMMEMLRSLDRATDQASPVLIQGETGVGKELVARALHANGPCATGPYVAENCAAISPLLMESELFGHVKGAFSGASADRAGLFRQADGGVLFLDEVGDLERGLQAKLLRVLDDGKLRPVGSDRTYSVKVRVVAATNRDLEKLVVAGKFRSDLFFRLASFRVFVPALRERREDIPELVRNFLGRRGKFEVDPQAMELMVSFQWPGNVRQLEHFAGVLSTGSGSRIGLDEARQVLGSEIAAVKEDSEELEDSIRKLRVARAQAAIISCDGNIAAAAKKLGMTYQGLRKMAAIHKFLSLRELSKRRIVSFKPPRPRSP
ncbi:MAG: hypothetical protein FD180_1747 [Planctomycetota bacterium]|nr:MAG: hypothetical protein FD180_1747 [Planctomycetota bacterium]